ncbi:cytochrome P450 2J5-like [Paroedura picta]|uniref:cytochrome P450 2J5-like n=1 Tax=Paroedura picta TaxID=143630 RepID=UPI00405700F1
MLGVLVALLTCLLMLHFLRQLWSHKSYPPGPLRLPIIGTIWRTGVKVHEDTVIRLSKQYGSISMQWLGQMPIVVLSGYEAVKEGLINHSEDFAERVSTPFLKALGQELGIIMSNGHIWKQQRKFGVATMRKLGLGKKGMEPQIEEEALQLVETFACENGQPFDPAMPITNSISNVICAMAFGHGFPVEDKEFIKLMEIIEYGSKFLNSSSHILYERFPWIMKHLPGPHKKTLAGVEIVLSFARKEIKKHKDYHAAHEPQDFIDFYLSQIKKISSHMKSEKVHKEIEDVLGSSQLLHYQDQKKLPYTKAVIHEIMRFKYILFFGIPRQCSKDVNMRGFLIPKGTVIVADLRSALLDPKQWETPEEFNPNHFLDKGGNFVEREAFLPFGAGARVCLGEQLARVELFIFFANLLMAFTFQLPGGVKELNTDPIVGVSVAPRPYKLCAVPRSSSS